MQVLDQVCTDYAAASDEDYLRDMGENIKRVSDVIEKYRKACSKAKEKICSTINPIQL